MHFSGDFTIMSSGDGGGGSGDGGGGSGGATGLQPGMDRVNPSQDLASQGWLGPVPVPVPVLSLQLKANSITGNTAALLQAKLQAVPKAAKGVLDFTERSEIIVEQVKKPLESVSSDVVEGVQLSKMPSLDMDMIWDALLLRIGLFVAVTWAEPGEGQEDLMEKRLNSSENTIGMVANLIEVASDEPLSVDGTVFGPDEEEGGVPEGELVGEAAAKSLKTLNSE
ncbi:hypothetical protein L1987_83892 [Smallanthus sonchifolius]|uniref:Uncharacterized protein n=1 Tax=Smallanthus sonchifolius TaxID=185202 RepID=A0ACB8YEP3_9ASTR|nr:hypothetical protein L1987_83892 [Smallanthus sonchifolius]